MLVIYSSSTDPHYHVQELFTRHYPFSEISSLGPLLARIVGGQFDRPSDESTCFRLSDEWWELCSMCWKRKPVDRPNISYVVQKIDQIMKVSTIGSVGSFSRHRHRNLPDPVSQLGKLSLILALACLSQMK